ncbi:Arylsulfatase [Pontiella desulfatans]|uniref:Arylsulfatase n=1 Tax=Pontiella desulfatans TaxID=2750659 RepID=A0A6C2U013_PONDE|nr:sulfatase [Pontiella desulfatans]SPS73764.1 sulfatase S1_14 [Kiritimatiellales bacterium]VGO13205.1 Arylsulfatase [Pontiella desulfatans]
MHATGFLNTKVAKSAKDSGLRVLCGLLLIHSCFAASLSTRPNIVIVLTDDQGYADLGCFGGKQVKTPRIDRMAEEGAKLTSFYVAGSVCTPSRSALMTGCYPKRIGLAAGVFLAGDKNGLNPEETTLAEVLKTAGYKTAIFGKWHLGDQPDFLPTRQGFDEFFGLPYSHDIHPFHLNDKKHRFPPLPLMEMETVIEEEPDADYLTKRITGRAVEFIGKHKDEPFFLYIPHPIPHRPIHLSPPFMEPVPDAVKTKLKHETRIDYLTRDKIYNYAINEIDWSVGQILDALKQNGIDENTVVVFTSDNGPSVGSAAPLSGKKGSSFEGGMRVPTVIRWPGKIPAGQVNDELMTAMDLLPTFAKLAGAEIPTDRVIDGKDIFPVLTGGAESPHEAFFYYKGNDLKAVRSGQWKLHLGKAKGNGKGSRGKGSSSPMMALYDLDADMGEKQNVLASHPEVAERLLRCAETFQEELAQNSRPAGFMANAKPLTTRAN